MKKITFIVLAAALTSFLATYVIFTAIEAISLAPLKAEIEITRNEKNAALNEVKELRTSLKPVVETCKLQNPTTDSFSNLAWPVSGAEVLSNYTIDNNRLEIETPKGAKISAVLKGEVASITKVENVLAQPSFIVIINHDKALSSVYARLASVDVKEKQPVLKNELLGTVLALEESFLHFEFRHCYQEINPTDFF